MPLEGAKNKVITSLKVPVHKKVAFVLILISLTALCVVIIKFALLSDVLSVKAITEIATSAFISVEPNLVGVGQTVRVDMRVEPAPPTPTDVFVVFVVTVALPDGSFHFMGPFMSYSNGSSYFEYMPTQVGTYALHFNYSGQYFANSTIWYMPSMSPVITLNVAQEPVQVDQQIVINVDGSINPPTVPISTADNVTYTLTDDIYFNFSDYLTGCLRVERSNIVINGAGRTLRGQNMGYGIVLATPNVSDQHNVTIANLTLTQFSRGIFVVGSSNTLTGNNITNYSSDIFNYGIYLDSSSDSTSIFESTLTNNGHGVYVAFGSRNNSISANKIINNQWGVHVYSSNNSVSQNDISNSYSDGLTVAESNNSVFANNITNSGSYGLLTGTNNSIFRNNSMNNNKYNFAGSGFNDIDVSNTVNGKPIYYWLNKQNMTVPVDAGYVGLINCTDITVQGLTLTNNGQGILLESTTNSRIIGNTLTNNIICIHVSSSSYNSICANNLTNNDLGFSISSSNYNNISANNIADNSQGLYVELSNHNSISENNIVNAPNYGFNIRTSNYNDISTNNITNNNYGILIVDVISCNSISANNITNNNYGIRAHHASNNTLYHNNFINNSNHVYFYLPDPLYFNSWDNGYPSGGNYWSNYSGTDANGDGIGDTPHVVLENETDRYPLMQPFGTETLPAPSPSPSPSSSPSPTPSPAPTPTPTPSPTPSPSPSPSPSASPSQSPSPSEQPTPSPQPPSGTPQTELIYAAAGAATIAAVTATAVALKKKNHKKPS